MSIALSMLLGRNNKSPLWSVLVGMFYFCGLETVWIIVSLLMIQRFTSKSVIQSNLMFYLISNFGCFTLWYPHTVSSAIQCYTLAIPFLLESIIVTYICLALVKLFTKFVESKLNEGYNAALD